MKTNLIPILLVAGLLLAGVALAEVKDPSEIGTRLADPRFGPAQGTICSTPGGAIPDADSGVLMDTITVTEDLPILELNVTVQIQHTWVGDLRAELAGPGCNVQLFHRIGLIGDGCCGCSADDVDVLLKDGEADFVENSCGSGPSGGSAGPWKPGVNPGEGDGIGGTLADCAGGSSAGDWTITVSDGAAGDTGTLNEWCLEFKDTGGDGGDGGQPVPAVTPFGMMALIALFLGISVFYLRRRSTQA